MDFRLLKMFFFFFFFFLFLFIVCADVRKNTVSTRETMIWKYEIWNHFLRKNFFSKQRMNFSPISRRDSKKKSLAIFFFLDRCERVIELFFLSFFLSVFLEFWKLPLFSTIYSEKNIRRII